MRILLDEDFWPGFIPGAIVHFIMVFTRITIFPFECKISCDEIIYYDIPISLFYFFLGDLGIAFFSIVFGGMLWGLYGFLILKMIRRFFRSRGIG